MSDAFGRLFGSFLQQLVFVVTVAILVAPQVVSAEPLLLLFNDNPGQRQEVIRKSAKQSTLLGLNKNGDMEIRHGGISLIVAYNPPNEIVEPQERLRIAQSQDSPNINGISLRVNFSF
jgi:hypothetical protein